MIILDTHAWIWLQTKDSRLSEHAILKIENESDVGLASITLWEVGMLAARNRITLQQPLLPWLKAACRQAKIRILPLTPEIAAESAYLPLHGDPADRIIVATAIQHKCPLITADKKITDANLVPTIW